MLLDTGVVPYVELAINSFPDDIFSSHFHDFGQFSDTFLTSFQNSVTFSGLWDKWSSCIQDFIFIARSWEGVLSDIVKGTSATCVKNLQ